MKHLRKQLLSLVLSGTMVLSLMVAPAQAAASSSLMELAERASRVAQGVQSENAISETLISTAQQLAGQATGTTEATEDVQERNGIICGGTVNVRSGPGTNYDRITQVAAGKKVTILDEKGGWYQISFGSTTGYVHGDYLYESSGDAANIGEEIVALALSFLGTRYVSGGSSPSGFDCSGFTRYLYAQYGYTLTHSATAQYKNFGAAVSKSELQLGDLVFFSDRSHAIGHVGLYIGNGQIIHARYSVGQVRIDDLSSSYYTNRYVGAKRILR